MKIYIKTYGCQMNERDSEALAGMLAARGHEIISGEEGADAMIFNTCSVRDQAERKAVGKLGFMKKNKNANPALILGVIGCMAQRRGEELLQELPHLDFVLGTGKLHTLPDLLESIAAERRRCSETDESDEVLTGMGAHYLSENQWGAQIAITRGCNRFCAYCIVPYVRGREISRAMDDVVSEARTLAEKGIREIMLLGQNVAAYGLNGNTNPPPEGISPFADLLQEIARIDGIERIRFTSPYPTYFNDKLIDTIAATPKVCRNIHLPLQSGSNRILKMMNRQYTAEIYWEIVQKLRAKMPELTFSTDVIVGFPGETEEDFIMTRDLMNRVGFDNAFIFKYSPRPGTRSAAGEDSVPQEVKEERNQILLADLAERTQNNLAKLVGTTVEVLAEGPSKRMPERWSGRTSTFRTVHFLPPENIRPGDLIQIRILRAGTVSLYGEVC
ncbi:MAG: tRNA (N6-isopentenyl adenosine(37)-C2)-methylthiotransferase MiaB [Lentisphaeria bacterium]|nr:tRNA (N6-isopentenyl adenosine(37)-C2)-methylthiotransferase MiaB [Lentisphaeria bacterium]